MSEDRIITSLAAGLRRHHYATADGPEQEARAMLAGAKAKRAGVDFHDNPHRHGPRSPDDWLYSGWEYGYCHADEILSAETEKEPSR